jgi:oligogalacturonide transporter
MMIVGTFTAKGLPGKGWAYAGLLCGLLSGGSILIPYFTTKGKEIYINKDESKDKNIISSIFSLLKIKTYRKIVSVQFIYAIANGILSGMTIYVLTTKMGISEAKTSIYYTATLVVSILLIPLILKIANKFGKKKAYMWLMGVASLGLVLLIFIDINTYLALGIFAVMVMLQQGAYQTLSISMVLDCCDLIDYSTGKRSEGLSTSIASLSMKAGFGVASWVIGLSLQFIGYSNEVSVQTPETLRGITNIVAIVSPVAIIITIAIIATYKLTGENFEILKKALNKRNSGEEYKNEIIEELI